MLVVNNIFIFQIKHR